MDVLGLLLPFLPSGNDAQVEEYLTVIDKKINKYTINDSVEVDTKAVKR